jgi:hypothetical protein
MGVFDEDVIRVGESREDDPLTKSIKEEAERLNDANQYKAKADYGLSVYKLRCDYL